MSGAGIFRSASSRPTDYEFLSAALSGGDGSPAARAAAGTTVRDWAAGALRAVADGSRPLRAVLHPLGFTCLPVERADRDGVCVHVWSPLAGGAAPAASSVHAHCWELTSYVLLGELENSLMTVTDAMPGQRPPATAAPPAGGQGPGAASAVYQVLQVRSRGDIDELSPTRRLVHCRESRRELITAGGTYDVPAGVFHATDLPSEAEAVTVALGRLVDGVADLSLAPAGVAGHRVRRRRCDPEQTAATARRVLGRLQVTVAR
jgi:hypothetical protein